MNSKSTLHWTQRTFQSKIGFKWDEPHKVFFSFRMPPFLGCIFFHSGFFSLSGRRLFYGPVWVINLGEYSLRRWSEWTISEVGPSDCPVEIMLMKVCPERKCANDTSTLTLLFNFFILECAPPILTAENLSHGLEQTMTTCVFFCSGVCLWPGGLAFFCASLARGAHLFTEGWISYYIPRNVIN